MNFYDSIQEAKEELGAPDSKGLERTVAVLTPDEYGAGEYPKYIRLKSFSLGGNLYWLTPDEQERLHEQW